VIKKDEVMKTYLKRDCDISDEYLPLAMSVIGDTGDDVDGIYGIGGKRFIDVFPELKKSVKSMENLYENVQNSKPIFDLESTEGWNKYMILIAQKETDEKFISNNLKLVSFELISRALDDPTDTEMIKRKEKIQKLFTDDKLSDCKDLKNALERSGVFLEDWLENLFFEVKIGDSTSA
jgi:5'-3' exonuclease